MTEQNPVVQFLVRSLQQVDPKPLTGNQLSTVLKMMYPNFSAEAYGCRTLREFISRNAPEIAEFGRSGMDVSYSLRSTQTKLDFGTPPAVGSPLDQLMKDPRAWKTFTSPDSAYRLYITEQGLLRSMHVQSRPLPEWREIPRISAETLLQIGRDFTADLEDPQKNLLVPLFEQPKWWIPFFDRLQLLGLKSKWIEFRTRRIRDEFQRRIANLGPGPISSVVELSGATVAASVGVPEVTTQPDSIRKIAANVVQRMTESELRALNLPLGYVVDALTTR